MTKQDILDHFRDIDFVYNDPSKHETLSRMLDELLKERPQIIRCKDCKFFVKKDYWVDVEQGLKMLAGDNVPTCAKWGGGGCLTSEDGYCYLAEGK